MYMHHAPPCQTIQSLRQSVCGCDGVHVRMQAPVPSGAVASAVAGLSSSAAMRTDGDGTDGGSDGSESGSDSSSNEDEQSRGIKVEG